MSHQSNPWIWQHAVDENRALRNFIHLLRAVHRWGVGLLRNRRKWWSNDLILTEFGHCSRGLFPSEKAVDWAVESKTATLYACNVLPTVVCGLRVA